MFGKFSKLYIENFPFVWQGFPAPLHARLAPYHILQEFLFTAMQAFNNPKS